MDAAAELWPVQFGDAATVDDAESVALDAEGNVYIAGKTEGTVAGTSAGFRDAFVMKLDSRGEQVWAEQFGSGGDDGDAGDGLGGGLGRISGNFHDGILLGGPPPPQVGPYRTPSFTSGRGMSPRGTTAGGRGHPASPPAAGYAYPPYDPTQHRAQVSHQGWYAHPPPPNDSGNGMGGSGGGGGVYPTQHAGGDGTDQRHPSEMTFAGKTFHPTDSAQTADVSDISGLSWNVGADIPSPSNNAAAGSGSGSGGGGAGRSDRGSGGGGGEMRFSHRSAWQHNQLRNRAARYAQAAATAAHHHPGAPQDHQHEEGGRQHHHQHHQHQPHGGHPSRYAQHLQQQQYQYHHHHHHGGQHQLPQPSPIKGSDKSKMSDLSLSMSFGLSGSDPVGKLARSLSIPGFKSGDLMSLGEASFHALLEDEALANFDAELRRANPQLGYAGGGIAAEAAAGGSTSAAGDPAAAGGGFAQADPDNDGKPPARESASSKSSSAAKSSGQHSAAEASQRSNLSMAEVSMASVRSSASSWMRNYRGQDPTAAPEIDGTDMVNPWLAMEGRPDSGGDQFSTGGSQLSILSEISTELMALDLADGPPIGARR